jgi:hypothetical protein
MSSRAPWPTPLALLHQCPLLARDINHSPPSRHKPLPVEWKAPSAYSASKTSSNGSTRSGKSAEAN